MKPLKIAHTEGHTDVCYDSSGRFILTGGGDGKVCILEGREDTDTITVSIGDKIYAIGFQGGRFFAASDENTIRIHTFPDGVSDGMVTRFTAPCRHFCLCDDGSLLIAGSDDFKIKVISMEEKECICLYSQHQAPVLSVALDPTREFIASSSCDGTVKIWNIVDGSSEKSLSILTKCNEISQAKSLCRMCWSQDGEFLLVPVDNEVHVLLRSSWEVVRKIVNSDITEVINILIMCPDGKHLAIGCINGDMGIYEWQNNKLVEKHSHPKHLTITSMAWNPQNWAEVAFTDNMGQLGFLDVAAVKALHCSTDQIFKEQSVFNDMDDDMLVSAKVNPLDGATDNGDADKFLDDDDENSIDIGSIKRSFLDNEDAGSVTGSTTEEVKSVPLAPVVSVPAHIFMPTPLQDAFQPGSTPEHLSSRFMVWNSIGIVRQYSSEDENSIDVEFHDTATHHTLHIDNKADFVMAALSTQALVLASRGDEETPSKLFCMHFGSWDNHKEWSYDMPAGESIQAVTVTESWVAVATELRIVRIFSVGGMQSQIFSVPGNVVALAANGNKLLVVYHKGMGVPGDQFMGVTVMNVKGNTRTVLINDNTLPLSPASKLAWIGFSEEGTPISMDFAGVVRMFNRHYGSSWCPLVNTKQHAKGKSDHYWLVSISERQEQIRCVPCKGSRYPPTLPRPAVAVLPFQLPLCDMSSEKSQHEESYLRRHLLAKNLSRSEFVNEEELNKPVREALIKLFAFAAKAERNFRAVEVCDLMEEQNLLHIAATYATHLKQIQLAERVSEIMHRRSEQAEQRLDRKMEESDEEERTIDSGRFQTRSLKQDIESDDEAETSTDNVDADTEDRETRPSGTLLKTHVEKNVKIKIKACGRSNPFKLTGSSEKITKGTQVFDKMEKTTPKASPLFAPLPVSIKKVTKKSNSNQTKLFSFKKGDKKSEEVIPGADQSSKVMVKPEFTPDKPTGEKSENQPIRKKLSAFDLWREANLDLLREEYPDLPEEELGQKTTEAFRALPEEERQSWVQKCKSSICHDGSNLFKKRKLLSEDGDQVTQEEAKKIKTEETCYKKVPLSQSTNAKLARFAKSD